MDAISLKVESRDMELSHRGFIKMLLHWPRGRKLLKKNPQNMNPSCSRTYSYYIEVSVVYALLNFAFQIIQRNIEAL